MKSVSIHEESPNWLAIVRRKVDGMRYGVVQIVVHDGRVIQIECTEKTRLDKPVSVRSTGDSRDGF